MDVTQRLKNRGARFKNINTKHDKQKIELKYIKILSPQMSFQRELLQNGDAAKKLIVILEIFLSLSLQQSQNQSWNKDAQTVSVGRAPGECETLVCATGIN